MKKYTNIKQYLEANTIIKPSTLKQYPFSYNSGHHSMNYKKQTASNDFFRSNTNQTLEKGIKKSIRPNLKIQLENGGRQFIGSIVSQRTIKSVNDEIYNLNTPKNSQSQINKQQQQYNKRQLLHLIEKLKQTRNTLELQIIELQKILEEVAINLQFVQNQFQKIKYYFIQQLSKQMDLGLINYKKKMVRWSKYQQIQKKSILILNQMDKYLKQVKIAEQYSAQDIQQEIKEINNKISHYRYVISQIIRVREDCIAKHPTIKQQTIIKLQQTLQQLCSF